MTQRAFNLVAGTVFLLVFLLHAARLFFHWEVLIAGRIVPMWLSWPALALAGFLVYVAFSPKNRSTGVKPFVKLAGATRV